MARRTLPRLTGVPLWGEGSIIMCKTATVTVRSARAGRVSYKTRTGRELRRSGSGRHSGAAPCDCPERADVAAAIADVWARYARIRNVAARRV